jgi:glycine hydroxymethyltransferase
LTQRGLVEKDMVEIANIIADLLFSMQPYSYVSGSNVQTRAKIDFDTLESIKIRVRKITERCLSDEQVKNVGYPQFFYTDDVSDGGKAGQAAFEIKGAHVRESLNFALNSDLESLKEGESQNTSLRVKDITIPGTLTYVNNNAYILSVPAEKGALAAAWLRDLSDGFIHFDEDLIRRIPGPFVVKQTAEVSSPKIKDQSENRKPYFIGIDQIKPANLPPLPDFVWKSEENSAIKQTSLHQTHIDLGAKMVPFAVGICGLVFLGPGRAHGYAQCGWFVRRVAHGCVSG